MPNNKKWEWTFGRYNTIIELLLRALPVTLDDLDPKKVITAMRGKGETVVEPLLREFFLKVLNPPDNLIQSSSDRGVKKAGDIFLKKAKDLKRGSQDLGQTQDLRENEYQLLEDAEFAGKIDAESLETVDPFEEEKLLSGTELLARAKKMQADFGQRQGRYFLENQNLLPEELQEFQIPLPGTILKRKNNLYMPYLACRKGRWIMDVGNLEHRWEAQKTRLLRFKIR